MASPDNTPTRSLSPSSYGDDIYGCYTPTTESVASTPTRSHRSTATIHTPAESDLNLMTLSLEEDLVIDPDGDLEILVRPSKGKVWKRYTVASQALRNASSVFRARLNELEAHRPAIKNPPQSFAIPSTPVLQLDDDGDIVGIVLTVLHHQYHLLPKNIKFSELVGLAVVVEKYALNIALAPIATRWAKEYASFVTKPGYEDWVLIAWVFGFTDVFDIVSMQLAFTLEGRQTGKKERTKSGTVLHPAIPNDILDEIHSVRSKMINRIRETISKIKDERTPEKLGAGKSQPKDTSATPVIAQPKRYCNSWSRNAAECDWLQLGHLLEILLSYGIHEADFWYQSVYDIITFFRNLTPPAQNIIVHPAILDSVTSLRNPKNQCSWVLDMQSNCKIQCISDYGLELGEKSKRFSSSVVARVCPLREFDSRIRIWGKFDHEQILVTVDLQSLLPCEKR